MTWTELGGCGAAVLGILTLSIGSLRRKQDVTVCDREHNHVDKRLEEGNKKFSKLEEKTDALLDGQHQQGLLLAGIKSTVDDLAKANKVKGIGD